MPPEPQGIPRAEWQVPSHDTQVFAARKTRYCICVFVINEGERIRTQLREMQPYCRSLDVIIADGGSTDGSLDPQFLEQAGVRTLLTKTGPGKLSAQMRMALAYAMDEGYSGVIVIDGNNKDDVSAIPRFALRLDEGYDHIQGSRYIPGGLGINTPLSRSLGVRLLHAPIISLAAGRKYTDTTNGFRAYSRKLLTDPGVAPFRNIFPAYELHYYLAIRAARLGFRTIEIPVKRSYPARGATPSKINGVRGNLGILKTLIRAALHRYNP